MGIHAGGCVFVGKDGKRRSLDLEAAASLPDGFKSLMASLGAPADGGQPRARRNAPVLPPLPGLGNTQHGLRDEIRPMPGSAIVNTQDGLALRGEEGNPLVEGKKVYGSVDGRKGFHTLDEIDPVPGGGNRVGPPQVCDEEDENTDSVVGFDGKGVTVPSLTRIHFERHGRVCTLKQYESERGYSPGRRLATVSPESSHEVATWLEGGEEEVRTLPFDIETDDDSGEATIVRCVFYYDGEERTVSDTPIVRAGSVWLLMDDSDDAGGEPTFSIVQDVPNDGSRAIRLYDFDDETGEVLVDYRDAYISFCKSGVTSLNGMNRDIVVSAGEGVDVGDGKTIWPRIEEDGNGGIEIGLTDTPPDGDGEDGDGEDGDGGYCNNISHEGGGSSGTENDISSNWAGGGGGGDWGFGEDENDISSWPCNN